MKNIGFRVYLHANITFYLFTAPYSITHNCTCHYFEGNSRMTSPFLPLMHTWTYQTCVGPPGGPPHVNTWYKMLVFYFCPKVVYWKYFKLFWHFHLASFLLYFASVCWPKKSIICHLKCLLVATCCCYHVAASCCFHVVKTNRACYFKSLPE